MDGFIEISNNRCERSVKPFVINMIAALLPENAPQECRIGE
ncbi:MAG: IS66 family transposase [Oscillospiraceae bacterium]|nr:IS66 family transposase [Oscillospiraceae bacterium]